MQPLSDRSRLVQGQNEAYSDSYAYKPVSSTPLTMTQHSSPSLDTLGIAVKPPPEPRQGGDLQGLVSIFCTQLNVLLVFVPLGVVAERQDWGSGYVFGLNFIAIVPLAGILGAATESLAAHTGQMLGGLLNATFGNAVEMIVTIQALEAGLISVVQGSLLGSILSNLLLVLGMAFFAGGLRHKEQHFNATGASTNTTCLVLSSIALALPTIYNSHPHTTDKDVLTLSRICAIVVAFIYVLFLVFQLHTHAHLFRSAEGEEEEEEALLSPFNSVVLLAATTCVVAYSSEFLVASIEGVTEEYGMPKAFIGVILLPIVGNAAEHATAVTAAMKGKMDLSLGVAVGSSTQIALFVVPFAVICGWFLDVPMSLDFRTFDATVLMVSVMLCSNVLHDGSSNWLEGAMLMATYVLIAIIIWFIPDEEEKRNH